MVELLAPGVYTLETSFRARSIQGVGTSTTGFVGLARSGPTDGPPQLVTSYAEFERIFGGLEDLSVQGSGTTQGTNYLAHAVRAFFTEMGARLYIARVFSAIDPATDTGRASAPLPAAAGAQVTFTSRFPGSGSNGTLRVTEVVSPATDEALRVASVGTMARSQGQAATPARLAATAAPAAVTAGAQLVIAVNGGAAQNITFAGTPATVSGAAPLVFPIALGPNRSFVVTADGLRQVIPLPANIPDAATLRNSINGLIQRAVVRTAANTFSVESEAAGAAVTLTVEPIPEFGIAGPNPTTASGTGIARLDRIRAADLNALFSAGGVTGVTASMAPGGMLVLETTGAGAANGLDISGTAAGVLAALGFAPGGTADTGTNAVERLFFIRTGTDVAGWQRFANAGAGWQESGTPVDPQDLLDDDDYIVTVTVDFTNADLVAASYEGMSLVPGHPRYIGTRMRAALPGEEEPVGDPLVLTGSVNGAQLHALIFANATIGTGDVMTAAIPVAGGNDGSLPPLATWDAALERLGLWDDIAIVAAPGSSAYPLVQQSVRRSLANHAVNAQFRIAVLDPPPGQSLNALRQTRGEVDTSYAAFYTPWVRVANPLARPGNESIPRELLLPPSGFVCGIYARNDQLRGVHKTPANEVIRSATGFETDFNQAQQGVLNPIGINCLRTIRGRGHRVYGGRLASSDREVVYVSDRRYLNFVKRSIFESMQWAVFEPNGPALWANVREAVASFLYNQWFNGALFGVTQDEAFFVVCDGSVMTQDDIDNGRMICEIGLALLKPAEFVVFRIGQKTADARR